MKGDEDRARGLPVGEALAIHCQQLGLPDVVATDLLAQSIPDRAGMMWLSDRAIMVHESPLGLAFDREEFDEILRQLKPI